ncbi:MAG TPA: hypothetical protein VNW99_01620 [Cytophagaceae bacterium]|jgi:hypothetical protein|nr:hypothetical protein [Cytophagaceae bacterium]
MDTSKTDYINILLMLGATILAFYIPFELFLFSYAILGPLHYLTEIGWLHQRNYFTTGKKDYFILIFLGLLITLTVFLNQPIETRTLKSLFSDPETAASLAKFFAEWNPAFVFLAFVIACGMTFLKKIRHKLVIIAIGIILAILLNEVRFYIIAFSVFFPTIIHVWFFTGIFILAGALKSRQFSSHVSLIVFMICSFSFFLISSKGSDDWIGEYVKNSFNESNFGSVNSALFDLLFNSKKTFFLNSPKGLMIQRFIAFAYTYHYLNWFSKTNIIRWHEVPKKWLYTALGLWASSIALYIYDFKIGFLALFFLSIMHVFLEFPLNYKSIIQITNALSGKRKSGLAES